MRENFFRKLAWVITHQNKNVLIGCIVFTILMLFATSRLAMKTQFSDMMPKDIPEVVQFEKIVEEYSSESTIMVTIESKDKDKKRMIEVAEELAKEFKTFYTLKVKEEQNLSLWQSIQLKLGFENVNGVIYDTLKLVKRVDYKVDKEFMEKHMFMLQKPKDLKNSLEMYGSLRLDSIVANINNNFEREFIDDADNMTTLDGESQAVLGIDGVYNFVKSIGSYLENQSEEQAISSVKQFLSGPEYIFSPDNTILMMMVQPSISFNEFDDAVFLGNISRDTLDSYNMRYKDVEIGGAGSLIMQVDENRMLKKDFGLPSLFALLLILVMLIGSFRSWKNPFFSIVVLVVGIIWSAGVLALVLHYLNMMSAVFGIMLIGLGIDFGIHFISGFKDGREHGYSIEESIVHMYTKIGAGVITGGLTTAIVFLTLLLTRFKALGEMGVAVGIGIIVVLFAMLVLLPALIVLDNKRVLQNESSDSQKAIKSATEKLFETGFLKTISQFLQFGFLETIGKYVKRTPVAIVIVVVSISLAVVSYQKGKNIGFQYNLMEMYPDDMPSALIQQKIIDRFEMSPDYAMLMVSSVEESRGKIEQFKKLGNRTGLIGSVDGISEFLPQENIQKKSQVLIDKFKNEFTQMSTKILFDNNAQNNLQKELVRLHQNLVEMGELSISGNGENSKIVRKCDEITGKKDSDSKILQLVEKLKNGSNSLSLLTQFQNIIAPVFKEKVLKMCNTEIITLDNLPKNIKDRYVSKNNDAFLITVFPKSNIWNEQTLRKFHTKTTDIDEGITGTPGIALIYIDLVKERGSNAILYGFIAILVFLLLDMRSIKMVIFATIPLIFGSLWMVGLMSVFDMKFNFVNFMALPLIIGIGIDDGVHILHRYKIEGTFSMPTVIKYTGRAILLTSLTTMIGFGSMGLASHKGISSMGQVLFFGVGTCFISSAFFLPALITLYEKLTLKNK